MPRGDRTGPWGSGSMTGRAAGYCAGYAVPGFMNPVPRYGRGMGFRRGWGRGRGRGFGSGYGRGWGTYPQQSPQPYPPLAYPLAQPPYQYAYPPVAPSRTPEQEIQALENWQKELEAERADLEEEMGKIASRLEELKATLAQGKK